MLTPLGFAGDAQAHPAIHGGPMKAVLIIASEVIEQLRAEGYPVYPGALGENLTTVDLDRRMIRPGQRFRAGQAFIEITRVRTPCSTLDVYNVPGLPPVRDAIFDAGVKRGDPSSPRWGMSGFYARVVDPGMIRTKDIIALTDQTV
jgi:MOSC domain-containing protein YiiM